MIYLNFIDLNRETQERLLSDSKEEVESRSRIELRQFAKIISWAMISNCGLP